MSLILTSDLIVHTNSDSLQRYRDLISSGYNPEKEYAIDESKIDDDGMRDISDAADLIGDKKTIRAIESILSARSGEFTKPIPNFMAFQDVLKSFLMDNLIDGWIYVTGDDGILYPELVTGIRFDSGSSRSKPRATVYIHTAAYGRSKEERTNVKVEVVHGSYSFEPQDVTNRRISDILSANHIYKETPKLKDAYLTSLARHDEIIKDAFAKQFRVNGAACYYEKDNYKRRGADISNRKVIHDLKISECAPVVTHVDSVLFDGIGEIPEHPVARVFDMKTHEFFWMHSDNLTPYVYNKSLREKLILPKTHRDLLDVLTSDIDAFVNDIIEGKSAGNVILCKGIAGVGKTLTAEIYAELIERPLYTISAGNLGTKADQISDNLQRIFMQAKRWECVLLLDEADVFVGQRKENIEQNAIVAEFLRTIEYFDGLLFMTTNRPNDIDDAIVSRCTAIINYEPPCSDDAAAIWKVMAVQYETTLDQAFIDALVKTFPSITPRDIKMLFRLALRMSKNEPLSINTFRQCAMFRAIEIKEI